MQRERREWNARYRVVHVFASLRSRAHRLLWVTCAVVGLAGTASGGALTWNKAGYAGTWDTVTTNWTGASTIFSTGDDVTFSTFAPLGGGSHYTHQTVTVDTAGVGPNSVLFKPAEIDYLHLSGGDISNTAGGITVDSLWSAKQAQLHFERTSSYTFSGDVIVKDGNSIYYKPTAAGAYDWGTGVLRIQDITNSTTTSFNYEPTVTNTTLNNDIRAESGVVTFNWGNYPKFAGDLLLGADIYFNSVGGGNEYFDWLGNVTLSTNCRITGGVRDIGRSGGLRFAGQFQGAAYTLTLDFQNSSDVGMQATMDTGAWNIANLVLNNGTGNGAGGGNTPSLLVYTANPTDDHFATLRGNGGKITIQNGAQLYLRRGSIDGDDVRGGAGTNRMLIDQVNAAYDVRIVNNPLILGTTSNRVNLLRLYGGSVPAVGTFQGDVTVRTGGVLRLETQYGHLTRHDGGNLRLEDGSRLDAIWSSTTFWSAGYRMGTNTQQILLGDGSAATPERITLSGAGSSDNGVFAFGVNSSNVIDDGNVILRYQQNTNPGTCFNIGWTDLASAQALTYAANTIAYPFRGGSAGTEFAPHTNAAGWLGVIGRTTGTVFTATNVTRHVTAGRVLFCNSNHGSYSGHRGTSGDVVVDAGGAFDLEATGTVEAASIIVTNGGMIGGVGTFATTNNIRVYNGKVKPGFPWGTLTVSNLVLSSNSELVYDLSSFDPSNEMIRVTGNLTLDGMATVTNRALGPVPGMTFTLMTFAGTLTDNGLMKNFPGVISVVGNEVRVTVPLRGSVFVVH